MNGFTDDKIPRMSLINDAVHWYMEELTHCVVAQTGVPHDRYHLGKLILHALKQAPDFILQINGATGESVNFASVLKRTVQCANGLRKLGVKTGDVMILMAPNHLDLVIPFYAALYLGVTIAPIDKSLRVIELEDIFLVNKPNIIFCQNEKLADVVEAANKTGMKSEIITFDKGDQVLNFADFLEDYGNDISVDDFRPSDFDPATTIAVLLSTSGTTGKPKSAAAPHKSFTISLPYILKRYTQFPTPTRLALIVSPLQWLSAIIHHILSPIMRYTKLQTDLPTTQEHTYDMINKYRPTFLIISPTMLTSLTKPGEREKCDFTCFEMILVGGSAVHRNLIADVKEIIPTTDVFEVYGMSEATCMIFQNHNAPAGSCGSSMGLYQYRLIDPMTGAQVHEPFVQGELQIRSPAMFLGYYNNPEATKEVMENGWLKTGDIFYRDENWNFFFVDRLKQLLKYKNHQISPVEVEGVIRKHPGVLDVAVVGIPDHECGDLPVACVVRRSGHAVSAHDIKTIVKENLTETKQLRGGVIFLDELPTTATTKLHRQKLKEIVLTAERE